MTANSTDTNQSSKKQRPKKPEHNFRVDKHQERWKVLNNNNPDRIRIIIDAVNHYNNESHRIQKLGGVIKKTDEYKRYAGWIKKSVQLNSAVLVVLRAIIINFLNLFQICLFIKKPITISKPNLLLLVIFMINLLAVTAVQKLTRHTLLLQINR